MAELTIGRRHVPLGNPGKALFTDPTTTKSDLAGYYRTVATVMLPHLRERPLALQRFPDGIGSAGFFQKRRPDNAPDWVPGARVPREGEGDTVEMICCPDEATLVYLADQAVVTVHPWLSRADRPRHPVRLVVDLDPPGDDFDTVRFAALALRDLLGELGLPAYPMTTGSRGMHVMVPLVGRQDVDEVRRFARGVADLLAARHPDRLTTEMRKDRRGGRLLLDVMGNAYAQHAVALYAPRPLPGAPVATPLDWDEVDDADLTARRYTVRSVPGRLDRVGDPWGRVDRHARILSTAARRLRSWR